MASSQPIDLPMWGDTVIVIENAPLCYKPNTHGSVCGIRTIETEETAQQFNSMIGETVYLVEFSNGEALEIPQQFLRVESEEWNDLI